MKRKGFTLVELLAVIVILAIIALIAVPLVLNTIDKAKRGAAEISAQVYINEIEKYMILQKINPNDYPIKLEAGKKYQLSDNIYEVAYKKNFFIETVHAAENNNDYVEDVFLLNIISVKGTMPSRGIVTIGYNDNVESATIVVDGYINECSNNKCKAIAKDDSNYIPAKSISIENDIDNIVIGETLKLQATVSPENATNKNIKWTSSDSSIASVDNSGNVVGKSKGIVTITAQVGGIEDSIELEVVQYEYLTNYMSSSARSKGGGGVRSAPTITVSGNGIVANNSGHTHQGIVYILIEDFSQFEKIVVTFNGRTDGLAFGFSDDINDQFVGNPITVVAKYSGTKKDINQSYELDVSNYTTQKYFYIYSTELTNMYIETKAYHK